MPNQLSNVELGALAYVAENRLREAKDIQTLTAGTPLSDAAAAYLRSVEDLFAAIRRRDATATSAAVLECHG